MLEVFADGEECIIIVVFAACGVTSFPSKLELVHSVFWKLDIDHKICSVWLGLVTVRMR